VLDSALRLLHPVVPFVTAELWARLPWPEGVERPDDLIIAPWPAGQDAWRDEDAERHFGDFQSLVVEVRRLRKEYGVGEGQRVAVHLSGQTEAFGTAIRTLAAALEQVARVNRVDFAEASGVGANAVLPNGVELFLPLADVIDVERERARMEEEIARLDGLLAGVRARLANEKFVQNAPDEVVAKARENAAQLEEQARKLRDKLAGLGA
jgi:valyl-tRNA synthetase